MKRTARKVWHVFRFRERFELPDDLRFDRRRPLLYSRDFVSAGDDESASYLRQIDAMSRHQNGLELEGAWSRIRRAASARSLAFRGYLLTVDNRPASDAEIGRTILFAEPRRVARILKSLEQIGLLEQVRCPIFDESQNNVTRAKRRKNPGNKTNRREGKCGVRKSVSREITENRENRREPLEKRQTDKRKGKIKEKERNPESARLKANTRVAEGETPCPPAVPQTVNPKANPQESAAAGVSASPPCAPPRPALPGDQPQPIGRLLPGVIAKIGQREKWTDEEAVRFGYEVFAGIWPGDDPETERGKSERGAFTAWLHKQTGDRQAAIDHGLAIARHVGKNRKSYRRPGAVWRDIVDGKRKAGLKARAG